MVQSICHSPPSLTLPAEGGNQKGTREVKQAAISRRALVVGQLEITGLFHN